jgi:hypothetical protein
VVSGNLLPYIYADVIGIKGGKYYNLYITKVTTKVTIGYNRKGRSSEARASYYVI